MGKPFNLHWDNIKSFTRPSKLLAIKVQPNDGKNGLDGIQLIFQNNIKTNIQQTKHGAEEGWEWRTIKIDHHKTISTVGLRINRPNKPGQIYGLKIYSDDYEELCNETWNTKDPSDSYWVYNEVPKGQQICGLGTCTSTDKEPFIKKIQFLLGTNSSISIPKPQPTGSWRPKFCE